MVKKVWMKRYLALLLAAVMVFSMVPSGLLASAVTIAEGDTPAVADVSTMDTWQDFFKTNPVSTENAGMVWTDKSVFTGVPDAFENMDIYTGTSQNGSGSVSMANLDDNFLVALSVMASNKTIKGYSTIPTDTVFVLDLSSSMLSNDDNGSSAIDELVDAANNAITRLFSLNKHNRVGVVLYAGNTEKQFSSAPGITKVLLPLDTYTAQTNDRYLSSANNNTRIQVANGVRNGAGQTVSGNLDSSRGTFIQDGIYDAMHEFLDADTTIADDKIQAGTVRLPIMVLMSDGEPTLGTNLFAGDASTGTTNGVPTSLGNSVIRYNDTDYGEQNARNSIAFVTQLTAAYARAKIAEHYNNTPRFYTMTFGEEVTRLDEALSVMDPNRTCNELNTMWNTMLNDGRVLVYNNNRNGNNRLTLYASKVPGYVDSADDKYYVDQYYHADSDSELADAFKEIVDEIILQSQYTPTLVDSGNHDLDGYVSFVDHVGEYMEVTDVKGMVIGNTLFSGAALARYFREGGTGLGTIQDPTELGDELVRSVRERLGITDLGAARSLLNLAYEYKQLSYTSDTQFSNYIGWYSDQYGDFVGFWDESLTTAPPANATHINKSYGFLGQVDEAHGVKPSDMMYTTVRVRTEIATGDVTMAWAIPAALIPTVSYEVSLAGDTYDSAVQGVSVSGATGPIRLLFEVALRSDIHEYNITEKVADAYKHYDAATNTYTFYTNDWNNTNQYDTVNTYSYFEASKQNERYYYTEDTVIYADAQGNTKYTGPSRPTNGYRAHYIYKLGSNKAEVRYEQISPLALANAVRKDGTWVIPKGTYYQLLSSRTREKEDKTITGTMDHVVLPYLDMDDNAEYHTAGILGNNGKLTVTPATGIKVTKELTETAEGADNTFTFTITAGDGTATEKATLVRPSTNGSDVIETLTFTDGKATFTVAAGETVYIVDLKDGVAYTIEEAEHADYAVESVNGTDTESVTIAAEAYKIKTADFVNAPKGYGDLFITKEVHHGLGNNYTVPDSILDDEFTITVNMGSALANETFEAKHSGDAELESVTTDENGAFTVTMKHTETLEIFDIPENTEVTVTESLADGSNFKVKYSSRNVSGQTAVESDELGSVTIGKDVFATVVVTNTYLPKPATVDFDVNITKDFQAESGIAATFNFKVQQWVQVGEQWQWADMDGMTAEVSYDGTETESQKYVSIENVLSDIRYTQPGEYAYQVLEVIPAEENKVPGVIYDRTLYTFTVVVTDVEGQLVAEIKDMEGDTITDGSYDITFTNTYHTAPVVIDVQKELDNASESPLATLANFRFDLYQADVEDGEWQIPESAKLQTLYSDGAGEARFTWTVDSEDAGTHYYILKENGTDGNGWTYDKKEYHITVEVAVEDNGNVTATVTMDPEPNEKGELVFTNQYKVQPAEVDLDVVPTVKKHLEGRNLNAGEFTFQIKDSADEVVAEGTNDAEGNVNFDKKLSFDKVGTYHYTVYEIKGSLGGVTYDETVYDMEVEVTDGVTEEGVRKLVADYYFEDALDKTVTFTNTYKAEPAQLTLGGTKALTGRTMLNNEFTFILSEKIGEEYEEIDRATNVDGKFAFKTITYTEPGEHSYTITELKGADNLGLTYDGTVHTVEVKVVDNGNGNLVAKINDAAVTEKQDYAFKNSYVVTGEVPVTLSGTKTVNGEKVTQAHKFSFELKDSAGKTVQTVWNDANGNFSFTALRFNTVGTYTYTVNEVAGSELGMVYDTAVYNVTIVVSDNGVGGFSAETTVSDGGALAFANTYNKPAELSISGKKTMDGAVPTGAYTFTLTDANDNVIDTVTNNGEDFTFDTLYFAEEGAYVYTVRETKGTDPNVVYDTTHYHVHVNVKLNDETNEYEMTYTIGNPSAPNTSTSIAFSNTSRESVMVHLEANKTLTGRLQTAGEFKFVLREDDNGQPGDVIAFTDSESNPIEVTNDAHGKVTFPALTFDAAGTYYFWVDEVGTTEVNSEAPYMKYDETIYKAEIVIANPQDLDSADPYVVQSVTYYKNQDTEPVGSAAFTNEYVDSGTADFSFTKLAEYMEDDKVKTRPLAGVEFTLTHSENCGNHDIPSVTATSNENGVVSFTDIPSGHYYILSEVDKGTDGNIEIGGTTYKVAIDRYVAVHYQKVYVDGVEVTDTTPVTVVNVPKGVARVALEGIKTMPGYEVIDNAFTFELVEYEKNGDTYAVMGGGKSLTEHNVMMANSEGEVASRIVFDILTYEKTGTYYYTVSETGGSDDENIIYDKTVYYVTVEVADENNDGELEATVTVTTDGFGTAVEDPEIGNTVMVTGLDFENKMRTPAEVVLDAAKTVKENGKDIEIGNRIFSFYLKNEAGEIIQTKRNNAAGEVKFDALTFDAAGTYHYTISEQAGRNPYIDYDPAVYNVEIEVKPDADGVSYEVTKKFTKVVMNGEEKVETAVGSASFTNTLVDRGVAMLELMKVSESGQPLENVEFVLTHNAECCDVDIEAIHATSRADGLVILRSIPSGHTYTLSEKEAPEGYVKTHDRTVVVSYGKVTVDGAPFAEGTPITIMNYYEGQIGLVGVKILEGRELKENDFSFALYGSDDSFTVGEDQQAIETVQNRADGTFAFSALSYDEVGTYYYVVKEVVGTDPNVDYDPAEYYVTVTVTADDQTGELTPDVKIVKNVMLLSSEDDVVVNDDQIIFYNVYVPSEPAAVELTGTKTLSGRDIRDNEFTFVLTDSADNKVEEVKNAGNDFAFGKLTFDTEGTYEYKVTEIKGTDDAITYDETVYEIVIQVKDNGKRQLVAETSITKLVGETKETAENIEFSNAYNTEDAQVTLEGIKTLTGRDLKAEEFSFQLADKDGKVLQTVTNGENGKFAFSAITYTEAGTYTYTVKEVEGDLEHVTYDRSVYTVTVTVEDDLAGKLVATCAVTTDGKAVDTMAFVNTYEEPEKPTEPSQPTEPTEPEKPTEPADPPAIKVPVTIHKTVINKTLDLMSPKGFQFRILDEDGKEVDTITANALGVAGYSFSFDKDDVDKTYTYTVQEVNTGKDGVTYSDAVYEIEITIHRNKLLNVLIPEIQINDIPALAVVLEFVNVYEPEVPTEPEKPTEKPTEPEKPTEKPTEPEEPTEPSKPTEPEDPTEPMEPTTEPTKPDPTKPTKPNKPTVTPQTGDESGVMMWGFTMIASMLVLAVMLVQAIRPKGKYEK